MRKPISQQDEQPLVSPSSSARRPSQLPPTGSIHAPRGDFREESNVQYTTASIRPRACLKLRDCTNTFQHSSLLVPSFSFLPNKQTSINFDCKQNPNIRTRKLEVPGYNPILDGYPGSRVHQEPILSASAIMRTKDTSKENKISKKEALKESYRNNSGTCTHQHQDGTYSSTCFGNQQDNNNYSQPPDTYVEKCKKQGKSQKIKTRHPSKSIAMNLNDMIMGKKKPKAKRPVTSATDLTMECTSKISTKIFSSNRLIMNRKDKENMLPILRNPGQNLCNSTCFNEKEGDLHSHNGCNGKNCPKCSTMAQKLKAQVQVAKTLQKQNGCLENIVTQKRNLVEQLTRQVRTLVRENQQLAKGCGKLPLETMLTAEPSATLPKIPTINLVGCSGNYPQLQVDGFNANESEEQRKSRTGKENVSKASPSPKKTESSEKLEEAEKRLSTLNLKCETIQQNYNQIKKENQEINRFLTDLLYTLNARGYESITDHEGNMIDLYRCKGDAFLDLRGRDARQRAPAKRLAPQETLLKAVIGSQERIIQNLICQLEDHQKEALIGQRLSLDNFHCQEGSRNSILEADILSLFALIEGACQRSPGLYSVLKEQHAFDSQVKANAGMNVTSSIVEAMLDRCQKVIKSMTPPSTPPATPPATKPRRETKSSTTCQTRFMQNHLARGGGVIFNENTQYPQHLDQKQNTKQQMATQKPDPDFPKNGIPLQRGQMLPEIPPRSRLPPQVTRSNSHTQAVGPLGPVRTNSPVLLANNMTCRGSSPRLRPNTSDNSINPQLTSAGHIQPSMSGTSEKQQLPNLNGDSCPYCTRQFSPNTSLAEINAHMEIHSYQAG